MAEPELESLTPYTDTLRDLINLGEKFEVFTKMLPILHRAAEAESAIPRAKATLDRITGAIDLANDELEGVQRKTEQAKAQHEQAVAGMNERAANREAQIRGALRKAQSDFEAEVARLEQSIATKQSEHDARMVEMQAEQKRRQQALDTLAQQIEAAKGQLDAIRKLVGSPA